MPLEYVGGASITSGGVTGPMTLSLTGLAGGIGSSAQVGDLVIVATGNVGGADNDPGVNSAGYTEVVELYADAVRDANLAVAYKRLTTAETSISLTGTGVAANAAGAVVHVWRGADPTTPLDVAVQSTTGINSRGVNPPAITPATTGAVVIAAGILTGTSQMSSTQLSSGYGNTVYITYDPGTAIGLGIASKEWAGGAEDPTQWTGTGGTTGDSWAAVTLAIRPAATVSAINASFAAASVRDAVATSAGVSVGAALSASAPPDTLTSSASVPTFAELAAQSAPASLSVSVTLPAVGGGIDDIPGLLWHTETPIEFFDTGPVLPPIPLVRAEGPVYCAIKVDTVSDHDAVIFSLSNPDTSRWVPQGFTMQRMWQAEAWLEVNGAGPGQLKRLYLPAAPSSHVWELWSDENGAVWNEADVAVPQFVNPDMRSPGATTELYFGYIPNNGDPALRGTGTVQRMALLDVEPSASDWDRLVDWLNGVTTTPTDISASFSASGTPGTLSVSAGIDVGISFQAQPQPDALAMSASVSWPDTAVTATLSASPDALAVTILASVAASLAAASTPDALQVGASVNWPLLEARLSVAAIPDQLAASAGARIAASLAAASPADRLSVSIGATWPSLSASAALAGQRGSLAAYAASSVAAAFAGASRPDALAALAAPQWPALGAALTAASAPDKLTASVGVGVGASALIASRPDTVQGVIGAGWFPIAATVALGGAPDTLSAQAAIPVGATAGLAAARDRVAAGASLSVGVALSAASAPDALAATVSLAWPGNQTSITLESMPDTLAVVAGVEVLASMAIATGPTTLAAVVELPLVAILAAASAMDQLQVRVSEQPLGGGRWAYPGQRAGGNVTTARRGGRVVRG